MIDLAEKITLADSLIVTVFSMAVVFAVLIVISFLIRILKAISVEGEKKVVETPIKEVETKQVSQIEQQTEQQTEDDEEEIVAAISAAIAIALGSTIPQIRIKTIRRINQNTTSWSQTTRVEQVMKRL